jgi:hypothetical protein
MSSAYSCLITREKIKVPDHIPHFKKSEVTTIPIDAENDDVASFIRYFVKNKVSISSVLTPEYPIFSDDVFGDPEKVLVMIKALNLTFKTFIVLHTADWADIPTDDTQGAFVNGELVAGGYLISIDDEDAYGTYDEAFRKLDIDMNKVEYYRDYGDASTTYIETIFNPGPWRSL